MLLDLTEQTGLFTPGCQAIFEGVSMSLWLTDKDENDYPTI